MSDLAPERARGTRSNLLPPTATQSYLLPTMSHPDCSLSFKRLWMLYEGLRIKPGINPRRTERALKRMVRRHDILRLRFVQTNGVWHAIMQDEDAITLKVEDHGDVSVEEMRRICSDIAYQTIEITDANLCDFRQLRFGKQGDVMMMRVHHSLTDGYGMMVLAEDFIKFFVNLPMHGQGYSHLDFLKEQDAKMPEHAGDVAAYWQDLLFPAPDPIPFGRYAKGMPLEIDPARMEDVVDFSTNFPADDYASIMDKATKAGATFFNVITTCFGEVMRDKTGADDIIGQTVLPRSSGSLTNYAGSAFRFPFFRTRISDGATLIERAAVLNAQIKTSTQYLSRELAKPVNGIHDDLRKQTGIGQQFFAYVAAPDGKAKTSIFKDLFRSQGGKTIKLGPVELERMPFKRFPAMAMPGEIGLWFLPLKTGVQISLRADPTVFEESELAAIGEPMLEKLKQV